MSQRREDLSLQPIVYRDFTGGLFELGHERGIPLNALLECTDCMPLPSGGLRAAWAWKEEITPNDPEAIVGFTTLGKVAGFAVDQTNNSPVQEASIIIGTTGNSSGTYHRFVAIGGGSTGFGDETFAGGVVPTWKRGSSWTPLRSMYPVVFQSFEQRIGDNWYWNIVANTSAVWGAWSGAGLSDTGPTQVFTGGSVYFITAHQQRLTYVTKELPHTGSADFLRFTEPTTNTTPPSSNFVEVWSPTRSDIIYASPAAPSDLFVLKMGGGAYAVQGDMSAGPVIRDSLNQYVPSQWSWGQRVPRGIAYMVKDQGVYLWSGGEESVKLSPQIVGSPMMTEVLGSTVQLGAAGSSATTGIVKFLGQPGYGGRWLFTPNGYIYDMEHQYWFKTSLPKASSGVTYPFWSPNPFRGHISAAGSRPGGGRIRIVTASYNEQTMTRSSSFSATLPLVDLIERGVQIRQIEVFGQGFGNGGTWTLEITNDKGQSETEIKAVPARAASIRVITKLDGDWLKIRVLSQGNPDALQPVTQASEAPMIDRLVLWARPHHRRAAA